MASYIKSKIDNLLATITNPSLQKEPVAPTLPTIKSCFTKRPILTSEPYVREQTNIKNANKLYKGNQILFT